MDSAIAMVAAPHTTGAIAAEKIGLRRIRLVLTQQHISASVGTFFAADQVLLSWAGRSEEAIECEFDIIYDDGYTLSGQYRFRRKATTRPALMAFIQRAVKNLCEGGATGPLVRGLSNCPEGFLARYEVADSGFSPKSHVQAAALGARSDSQRCNMT